MSNGYTLSIKVRLELVRYWAGNILNLIEQGVDGESFADRPGLDQIIEALESMFDKGFDGRKTNEKEEE